MPAPIYDVLYAEIEFARHDDGMRFAGQLVEEVKADAIDLVVNVEAAEPVRASGLAVRGSTPYHLMYFLWSFIITSMKSSTVAGHKAVSPGFELVG